MLFAERVPCQVQFDYRVFYARASNYCEEASIGGRACFYMGNLPISPFIGNERSRCLHSLISVGGTAPFPMLFTPLSIHTTEILMSCVLSERVGVLLTSTLHTLFGELSISLWTFTGLVVFRSMAKFMTRLPLTLRSSSTETSRTRG